MSFTESLEKIVEENANGLLGAHPSWVRIPLSNVAQILNGFAFPSKNFSEDSGTPLLRIRDVLRNHTETYYNGEYDEIYLVETDDLVIGMDGDFHCTLWQGPKALLNQRVCKLTPDERFYNHKLLVYVLGGYLNAINEKTSSITVKHLSSRTLTDIPLPLPPLPEQQRIVDKIEELLTQLDAGVEALEKIKAQLKRYRQAVLRHAFEGNLTAEWREAHKGEIKPASVLLERIREERKRNARGKYKEPVPVDTSGLPELPEGWVYNTLDVLVSDKPNSIKRGPFGSAIKKAFFVPSGYKVYEQRNVIYNDFDVGSYFIDESKFQELKGFEVKSGDILMSCSGTVGKIVIVPDGIQAGIINQALLKITLDNRVIDTSYFIYLFRSKVQEILWENTRGSAMVNISSVKDLKKIPFPIPPILEQTETVQEIERYFSIADEIETTLNTSIKQADMLRQSILKTAFEGKLVSQDPNDEPAEKLLECIKAEKAKSKK